MSQTSLLNGGAAVTLLALLTSVFCQVTDHQMLIENCNWQRTMTVSPLNWPEKTLESPSTGNHNLASNLVCQTQVTALYNYDLKLRVLNFDLRGSSDCRSDSERVILQISGYPNITWCGTTYPEEMILPRGSVNVIYNTGIFGVGTGFKMEFSTVLINSCYQQRNLSVATQPKLLYSPNYPGLYGSDITCTVFLNAEDGQYIHIQSLVMDIESSSDCRYDALTINKVKYCGKNPIDVVVNSSMAQIGFSSDYAEEYSGFVLKYATFKPAILTCNSSAQYFTVNASTLQSLVVLQNQIPSGSQRFNSKIHCQVTLDSGSPDRILELIFPPDLKNIANYKLEISRDPNQVASGMTVITNSSGPRPYQTQGPTTLNFLRTPGRQVVFSADLLGNRLAFFVQAVARDSLPPAVKARYSLLWVSPWLTSVFGAPRILIVPNKTAVENIEVGLYNSNPFDTSLDNDADRLTVSDYVAVYNGEDTSYFELTRDCNGDKITDKAIYSVKSQNVTVVFNWQYLYSGFWLYIGPSNGNYLPKSEELSTYKNFRSSYQINMKNLYCTWVLSQAMQTEMIRDARIISISANNNFNPYVSDNSFTVADGKTVLMRYTQQTELDSLVYSLTPINITVSIFNAVANTQPIYFNFLYQMLDSQNIQTITCQPKQLYVTEAIQFETTPNYPNTFVTKNCEWTIQNSFSYSDKSNIALAFPDLSDFNCLDNEVQILTQTGSGGFYLFNRLCKQRSFNATFAQDQVKIRLISVATYMQQGFSFAYCTEAQSQEVTLYASEDYDYLTSPNYPKNYSNGLDYTWHITTTYYASMIVVELMDFSLEEQHQILKSFDYVSAYDGPTKYSPLINVFYGKVSYTKISSTGPDMTIVFHSDAQNSDKGFRFKYRSQKIADADSGDCCKADYTGVIVGAVAGGIFCLVFIVGVIIFVMRRRKRLRASTSNTVSGQPAGNGVPVARGNRSMFIMSPATMNVNLAPPSYLTVQNTHPSIEPPPYSSLHGNTDHVLPAYTPRLNDFENPAYGVHDLPPPYSSDMPGGTAQQVSRVIHIVYSRQGSSASNIEDRAHMSTTSGAGADISLGISPGVRDEVVGDHVISENIYNEITPSGDHVMAIASAPSEMELPPLTQHLSHVDINTLCEAPPAYENGSFLQDNGQQRILPHKKNDNLGWL